ncbi:MAG: hypothetical protein ACRCVN_00810 [Spirochaetia bacterium]
MLNTLFHDIKTLDIEQGGKEWLALRKARLTSTDVTTIVLEAFFNTKDARVTRGTLFKDKVEGKKIDIFLAEKFRRGKVAEAIILGKMRHSQLLTNFDESPVYANSIVSVSPDATGKRLKDGIHEPFVYEIKWTDNPHTVFYPIQSKNMNNYYFKKYCTQLFYHVLAYTNLHSLEKPCDGVLLFSFEDPNSDDIVYKSVTIPAYDQDGTPNIWIRALCASEEELIHAATCFSKGIDPYEVPGMLPEYIKVRIQEYIVARREKDLSSMKKDAAAADILAYMHEHNIKKLPFMDDIGIDMSIDLRSKIKKEYVLNESLAKEEEYVYNTYINDITFTSERLSKLQEALHERFYDVLYNKKEYITLVAEKDKRE